MIFCLLSVGLDLKIKGMSIYWLLKMFHQGGGVKQLVLDTYVTNCWICKNRMCIPHHGTWSFTDQVLFRHNVFGTTLFQPSEQFLMIFYWFWALSQTVPLLLHYVPLIIWSLFLILSSKPFFINNQQPISLLFLI